MKENWTKALQILYQTSIIPLVGFIAIQTYQINAHNAAMQERIKHLEFNQTALMLDQRRIDKNQNILCSYAEPTWPTHAKCER